MNTDPTIRNILKGALAALGTALLVALMFSSAGATQPSCTGNRHYDARKGCCVENTTTTSTTSTTLPPQECPEPEACDPVLPCPDVPACPPVVCTCQDGHAAPPTIVQVDRCPEPEVSEVCKVRKNGSVVCPRSRAGKRGKPGPRKIYVPRSIIDKIADVERY